MTGLNSNHDSEGGSVITPAGADPCVPNPCRNGGKCSTAEDPLIGIGMRFYCICKSTKQKKYGGYYCEIGEYMTMRCHEGFSLSPALQILYVIST